MKTLAVLAANGKLGRLAVKEGLLQGARVVAFVRKSFDTDALAQSLTQALDNKEASSQTSNTSVQELLSRLTVIEKDIFSLQASDFLESQDSKPAIGTGSEAAQGREKFCAILDCFGEFVELGLHKKHLEHLAQILRDVATPIFIVGGAGSLYMDSTRTKRLLDTPDFPAEYKPLALAMALGLDFLRGVEAMQWCYVSPPALFLPDIARTGEVEIIGEEFRVDSRGESKLGYADYAYKLCSLALHSPASYIHKRVGFIAKV